MAVDHQCSVQNQMTPTMFTTIQTNQFSRTFLVVSQVASKEKTKNCASNNSRPVATIDELFFEAPTNFIRKTKPKPNKNEINTHFQMVLPIVRMGKASFWSDQVTKP